LFEGLSAFFESACVGVVGVGVLFFFFFRGEGSGRDGKGRTDIAPVHDENDGVTDAVVGCPHAAEGVLAAYVPDSEIQFWKGDCGDVLADGGEGGFLRGGGGGGGVEGFDGGEEGGFAGVVEAEEEDGVFWDWERRVSGIVRRGGVEIVGVVGEEREGRCYTFFGGRP